ncbi:uncharacterized protein ARMOST_16201 [Armillaria ostoyae]|uniref:Tf2-1-like SH3-like domain-containing protein n=1 Tax=Armillaria ostoyae TaxID=47428 RepID=A0A284RVI0_ARMOS|nr:uncharacterized protein ARMOST_16201 [Armillaria ostoyae]
MTRKSPFMVIYGQNPRIIPDSPHLIPLANPATTKFSTTMAKIHKETKAMLEEAAGRMKKQYDKQKHSSTEYSVGDHIWLDATNLHLPCLKKKLDDKQVRPFEILEKAGVAAYKLKLLPHWKIHPCFNEKLLTPYTPPTFLNQELPPPPLQTLLMGKNSGRSRKY